MGRGSGKTSKGVRGLGVAVVARVTGFRTRPVVRLVGMTLPVI